MAQDLMISAYRSKKILKDMDSDGTAFCMGLGKKSMVFLCDPAGLTYGELAIDRASRVTFIIA